MKRLIFILFALLALIMNAWGGFCALTSSEAILCWPQLLPGIILGPLFIHFDASGASYPQSLWSTTISWTVIVSVNLVAYATLAYLFWKLYTICRRAFARSLKGGRRREKQTHAERLTNAIDTGSGTNPN